MPFLPFVLLLAWQALSKSASFALGWATAIYFGQVPGRQGRVLSVVSLVAAGWVIVVVGFAIPILGGAALEAAGVVEENFDVEPLTYVGLVAGIVLTPPLIAAMTVYAHFHDDRSFGTWLRMVPMSYPASAMLGASVLQMVAVTPVLLFQRWRQKRKLLQVPLVLRDGADDDDLTEAVQGALAAIGLKDVAVEEATGPKSWPLRTVGFASRHLLGAVVRGEPVRLATASSRSSRMPPTCRSRDRRKRRIASGPPWSASLRSATCISPGTRNPRHSRTISTGCTSRRPMTSRSSARSWTRCRLGSTSPASTSRSGTSSIGSGCSSSRTWHAAGRHRKGGCEVRGRG